MVMNSSSYKQFHENYMKDHTGSTVWDTLFLITPYPILIYFVSNLVGKFNVPRISPLAFLIEYIILIVPIVIMYTVLSAYIHIFFIVIVISFIFSLLFFFRREYRTSLKVFFMIVSSGQKRLFITYFRSICSILTAFCILAVDFSTFPRRFAKTESYGFSLMDTGVGFFIISNGLVTKPNIKDHFIKSLKSSIPIIILGVARCLSVNILDYQQHVSEYGVYWNFFFTLAVVKLTCPLLLAKWPSGALPASITLALMHQAALTTGIEDWIIKEDSREDVLSANKEGFISLPGYLSLYLAAVFIGRVLHSDRTDYRVDVTRIINLIATSSIFFTLTIVISTEYPVSRRLMNITYITWLLCLTFLMLALCMIIEISVKLYHTLSISAKEKNLAPIIVEAVNFNGLPFFLIANILTGVINLSLKTLYESSLNSVLILGTYMLFICFVVCLMYRYRVKISL